SLCPRDRSPEVAPRADLAEGERREMSAAGDVLEDRTDVSAVGGSRDRHRGQDVHDEHHCDRRVRLRKDRRDLRELVGAERRPADRLGKQQAEEAALSECANRVAREAALAVVRRGLRRDDARRDLPRTGNGGLAVHRSSPTRKRYATRRVWSWTRLVRLACAPGGTLC